MAKQKGIALNAFSMEDHGVPYGYSPVLVTTPQVLRCASDLTMQRVHLWFDVLSCASEFSQSTAMWVLTRMV